MDSEDTVVNYVIVASVLGLACMIVVPVLGLAYVGFQIVFMRRR